MTSPHHPPQAGQPPVTAPQQQPGQLGYGPPPQGAPQQGPPPQGPPPQGPTPQGPSQQTPSRQTWPQPPPSYPAPQHFAEVTAPPLDTGARARRLAGWITLAGAAIVVVGSVLPWASVMFAGSVYGTDGDGILTIFCAVIVALVALPAALGKGRRWMFGVAAFFGLVATAIGGYDLSNISALVSDESMASLGPGLPIVVAGGLVVVVASIFGIAKGKRP
ncbi:hypothetical protein MWU75_07540 [Ornithinimicrobium sp. F0845]|uniref:hypothetical protein n=1 Tax=Ornithinimicrobium sp. F0845 TaxID=2926412 RepID=UPI001FF6EBD3|nr:hypothetical protein [Ornithinimicrobium sp. F0845]MCK0111986.1 hypothetical protein [Ornithinimicrobium sp. F0845]